MLDTTDPKFWQRSDPLRHRIAMHWAKVLYTGNYASAAGGHPTISVFDEAWAYTSERSRRLYDELVPVPTKQISCRLVVTYVGFSGEGQMLEEMYTSSNYPTTAYIP